MATGKHHSTSAGGGSADKLWNRYESAWTLHRGVLPVMRGQATSITVEPPGAAGEGIEFRLDQDGGDEVHQVKGGLSTSWTINALKEKKVLAGFKKHLTGTTNTAVFFSVLHAARLDALCRKAAVPAAAWLDDLTGDESADIAALKSVWGVDDDDLRGLLSRIKVRSMDDQSLPEVVEFELESLIEGRSPKDARNDLETYILENLHVPLTAAQLWEAIRAGGGRRREGGPDPAASERVREVATSYAQEVQRGRPRCLPYIERPEVDRIVALLTSDPGADTVAIVGRAGSGKSTVCAQLVERLQAAGIVIGALRLDRATPAATAQELGAQEAVGFGEPVAQVMSRAAAGHPCVLVVDQLDALSAAAGRGEAVKDGLRQTLRQARAVPDLRLVIACRSHDLREDRDLRWLLGGEAATAAAGLIQVDVGDLDDGQLDSALTGLGIDAPNPPRTVRKLLSNAFNLSLLAWIVEERRCDDPAAQVDPGGFPTRLHLLREYDRLVGARLTSTLGANAYAQLTQRIAARMSGAGLLSIPSSALSDVPDGRLALLHEGILVESGHRVRFFHQAYFEFVFAQQQFAAGRTAMDLLRSDVQDLVRRGQVRMLLALEREQDAAGVYKPDLREVLTASGVRTHVRAAVLDWLTEADEPDDDEVALVVHVAVGDSPVRRRALTALWTPSWVTALHRCGFYRELAEHLLAKGGSDPSEPDRDKKRQFELLDRQDAWLLLEAAVRCAPERTAESCLPLARDRQIARGFAACVLRLVFVAGPGTGASVTNLFVTLVETVRADVLAAAPPATDDQEAARGGEAAEALAALFGRSATDALHTLVMKAPTEAVRAYRAWFEAADAIAHHFGPSCAFAQHDPRLLPDQESGLGTLQRLAEHEPAATADLLVPFVITQAQAMPYALPENAAQRLGPLRPDKIWPTGLPGQHDYASEVLRAAIAALSTLARDDPDAARPLLAQLAAADLVTARHLLGTAYATAAVDLVEDALSWAEQPEHRTLHSISPDGHTWGSVIAHVIDTGSRDQQQRAESLALEPYATLDLTAPGEPPSDDEEATAAAARNDALVYEQHDILATIKRHLGDGIPDSLCRRLEALTTYMTDHQVAFAPHLPGKGVYGVASPIPQREAAQFTDDAWIDAITRLEKDAATFELSPYGIIGGAATFAQILNTIAATSPLRFARLLPRMAPPINAVYPAAVLRALAGVRAPVDDELRSAIFDALRTVHGWTGHPHALEICQVLRALAAEQIPTDVLEILVWIVREHPDPASEIWTEDAGHGRLYYGGSITDAGLNCARGYAIDTIGTLISSTHVQPERLDVLLPAVRAALGDEREQVRVMIPDVLLWLTAHDRQTASDLTRLWLEKATDAMLQAQRLAVLAYNVRDVDPTLSVEITEKMLTASAPHVRQTAGQLAVALAPMTPESEPTKSPLVSALADPSSRQGVGTYLVEIADQLVNDLNDPAVQQPAPRPGWKLLIDLLDDPDSDVNGATATALGAKLQHLTQSPLGFDQVLRRIAGTRGFIASGYQILRGLHLGLLPVPDTAVDLCRAWFDNHRAKMAHPGTSERASADHLIPIVLSVYGSTTSGELRIACLDLIDEMIEAGVDEASRAADEAESSE